MDQGRHEVREELGHVVVAWTRVSTEVPEQLCAQRLSLGRIMGAYHGACKIRAQLIGFNSLPLEFIETGPE